MGYVPSFESNIASEDSSSQVTACVPVAAGGAAMAQGVPEKDVKKMIKEEQKLIQEDPLHEVKEQILHEVDETKSVQDSGEKLPPPQAAAGEGVVKSEVAPTFAEEYKRDHESAEKDKSETKKQQ
ncbi:hypothetical protein R1sor_021911 [Riccia sorocarpa]|uniref:Uncharacterized protein n=1 Tax=Riccia sorocarpa TaxID=122646 RepID=A0ABD3GLP0_9MARC